MSKRNREKSNKEVAAAEPVAPIGEEVKMSEETPAVDAPADEAPKTKKAKKAKDPNAPAKVKSDDSYGVLLTNPAGTAFARVQTKHLRNGIYLSRFLMSTSRAREAERKSGKTSSHDTFASAKTAAEALTAAFLSKGWNLVKGVATGVKKDEYSDIPEATAF